MKTVLEFGIRGGMHTDNIVLPSVKLATRLASDIARVLTGKECPTDFGVSRTTPRITFRSASHFVAVSLLDGVPRGPASATLWKTDEEYRIAYVCNGRTRTSGVWNAFDERLRESLATFKLAADRGIAYIEQRDPNGNWKAME